VRLAVERATLEGHEQGDAEAQFALGLMYDNGEAVSQDKAEAVRWYRMAAEQGNAKAQASLRRLTGDETPGVPKP
jgi:TPR repeat protein